MDLQTFLNSSYTAYHAVSNVTDYLLSQGFTPLTLGEAWHIKRGGKYFVTRNGSSVIIFRVGNRNVFNVCESHTDSPCFKVKGNGVLSGDVLRLNTEKYGGGLLYTFMDRPLKIAGRLLTDTRQGVATQLVVSDYNVVIPSMAIHHNPTANDSLSVNPQVDLPLLGCGNVDLYATLTADKVLDADLYVVPSGSAFVSGVNGEFINSARLDNLTSVYASVTAIVQAEPCDIAVVACLDNEETGSKTQQGSPMFLLQTLQALCTSLGLTSTEQQFAYEQGFMLSVDNAHALHPNHPDTADVVNPAVMGGGITIKHHPNYATDGLSSALFKKLLADNGIGYQDYYNRSDVRCGSTLGLATSASLGIRTCDVGIAQLAMHSACETCALHDVQVMQEGLRLFLSARAEDSIIYRG